jgi:GT2 family glycosyltransferase
MPEISIVIPNYILNQELLELTKNCIQSFKKTAKNYELILIDDGSIIGSDYLKKEADIYIKNEKNLGYAPTVNKGWKEAKGQYIVTSNNDIEVYEGWQEEFIKILEKYQGDFIGGLGYRAKIVDGMPIEKYKENPGSRAYGANYISIGGQFESWMFPGGLFLQKREVLDKIGYFDENYEHGGYEDIDFFYRAKLAGLRLLMTPKVAYWHKEGATRFSEIREEKERQTKAEIHNLEYFIKKWNFNPHQELYRKIFQETRINF